MRGGRSAVRGAALCLGRNELSGLVPPSPHLRSEDVGQGAGGGARSASPWGLPHARPGLSGLREAGRTLGRSHSPFSSLVLREFRASGNVQEFLIFKWKCNTKNIPAARKQQRKQLLFHENARSHLRRSEWREPRLPQEGKSDVSASPSINNVISRISSFRYRKRFNKYCFMKMRIIYTSNCAF